MTIAFLVIQALGYLLLAIIATEIARKRNLKITSFNFPLVAIPIIITLSLTYFGFYHLISFLFGGAFLAIAMTSLLSIGDYEEKIKDSEKIIWAAICFLLWNQVVLFLFFALVNDRSDYWNEKFKS